MENSFYVKRIAVHIIFHARPPVDTQQWATGKGAAMLYFPRVILQKKKIYIYISLIRLFGQRIFFVCMHMYIYILFNVWQGGRRLWCTVCICDPVWIDIHAYISAHTTHILYDEHTQYTTPHYKLYGNNNIDSSTRLWREHIVIIITVCRPTNFAPLKYM